MNAAWAPVTVAIPVGATGGRAESYGAGPTAVRGADHEPLGGGVGAEALGLGRAARLVPAQLGPERPRHALGRLLAGGAQAPRGGQPEAGAAQQHVADAARLLAAGREGRLGQQVGHAGQDRLGELAALGGGREHVVGGEAVAAGELLVGVLLHALDARELVRVDRHPERDLAGAAGRLAAVALDQAVDGHLRHPPPGRELAAGDRDHAARGLVQLGLARDVDRLLRVAGRDQRPHARVGARDVLGDDVGREERR